MHLMTRTLPSDIAVYKFLIATKSIRLMTCSYLKIISYYVCNDLNLSYPSICSLLHATCCLGAVKETAKNRILHSYGIPAAETVVTHFIPGHFRATCLGFRYHSNTTRKKPYSGHSLNYLRCKSNLSFFLQGDFHTLTTCRNIYFRLSNLQMTNGPKCMK